MRAIGLRGSALAKLHDLNRQMMKPLDGILHLAALSCSCIGCGSLPTGLGELFMSALMMSKIAQGNYFQTRFGAALHGLSLPSTTLNR
jgi:hypothetical protein